MQAIICDECKSVITEAGISAREPLEIKEGNFNLVISMEEWDNTGDFELCPACIKKGQYRVARKAFDSLKGKKEKKAKPVVVEEYIEFKSPEEEKPEQGPEEKPNKKKGKA